MKVYVLAFGPGSGGAAGEFVLSVLVAYYGIPQAENDNIRVVTLTTDTPAQIRTKILDAIVAQALQRFSVTLAKSSILLPTYAPGS